MKLKIVNVEKRQMEMIIGGEGHTLVNLLQSTLLKIGNVKMAGYAKTHPLMDRSTLYVTLKRGKDFNKVLLKASSDAKKLVEEFLTKLEAALPESD